MKPDRTMRILCVEDSCADFELIRDNLELAWPDSNPDLLNAASLHEACNYLTNVQEPFTAILLDLSLPDSVGEETFLKLQKVSQDVPIIVLTGFDDEELGIRLVQRGAEDYVPKSTINAAFLSRSISYAIERKRSRSQLALMAEQLSRAHDQLIQAEKLESLGRLAAGVAHEVKNPLAVIQMGVDFFRKNKAIQDDPLAQRMIVKMKQAIDRADHIIVGMVDLSRNSKLNLQIANPNEVVQRSVELAQHEFIRAKVELKLELAPCVSPIRVDIGKIEQVLLNLILNGIQAMPSGGFIRIRTMMAKIESAERDEGWKMMERLREGDEVVIVEARDTGPGIPEDKLRRVFEPFYTTKPTGVGTGLGLSVAKNILDLHHGYLHLCNVENPTGLRVRMILKPYRETASIPLPDPDSNDHTNPTYCYQ